MLRRSDSTDSQLGAAAEPLKTLRSRVIYESPVAPKGRRAAVTRAVGPAAPSDTADPAFPTPSRPPRTTAGSFPTATSAPSNEMPAPAPAPMPAKVWLTRLPRSGGNVVDMGSSVPPPPPSQPPAPPKQQQQYMYYEDENEAEDEADLLLDRARDRTLPPEHEDRRRSDHYDDYGEDDWGRRAVYRPTGGGGGRVGSPVRNGYRVGAETGSSSAADAARARVSNSGNPPPPRQQQQQQQQQQKRNPALSRSADAREALTNLASDVATALHGGSESVSRAAAGAWARSSTSLREHVVAPAGRIGHWMLRADHRRFLVAVLVVALGIAATSTFGANIPLVPTTLFDSNQWRLAFPTLFPPPAQQPHVAPAPVPATTARPVVVKPLPDPAPAPASASAPVTPPPAQPAAAADTAAHSPPADTVPLRDMRRRSDGSTASADPDEAVALIVARMERLQEHVAVLRTQLADQESMHLRRYQRLADEAEEKIASLASSLTAALAAQEQLAARPAPPPVDPEVVARHVASAVQPWMTSMQQRVLATATQARERVEKVEGDLAALQAACDAALARAADSIADARKQAELAAARPPPPPPAPPAPPAPIRARLPDFALIPAGARVVHALTSRTYAWPARNPVLAMLGMTTTGHPPEAAFLPVPVSIAAGSASAAALHASGAVALVTESMVGRCWAMAGDAGFVTVQLARPATVSHVAVAHLPRAATVDFASAPRRVRVFALYHLPAPLVPNGHRGPGSAVPTSIDDVPTLKPVDAMARATAARAAAQSGGPEAEYVTPFKVLLAELDFDDFGVDVEDDATIGTPPASPPSDAPPAHALRPLAWRTAPVRTAIREFVRAFPVTHTAFAVVGNHGHPLHTCVYRFAVHGKTAPGESAEARAAVSSARQHPPPPPHVAPPAAPAAALRREAKANDGPVPPPVPHDGDVQVPPAVVPDHPPVPPMP
ncbi:hypothetical protein H9P43_003849 [Blastocladiella emersonii ATCC 22665]|nr:hypothetical protein H9P43_003849 [Blastocladiella emersonii ATCC 22665]